MKKVILLTGLVLILLSGTFLIFSLMNRNNAQAAADNCTEWSRQPNGCDERVCARDSDASMYCQQRCNGRITNIACK